MAQRLAELYSNQPLQARNFARAGLGLAQYDCNLHVGWSIDDYD